MTHAKIVQLTAPNVSGPTFREAHNALCVVKVTLYRKMDLAFQVRKPVLTVSFSIRFARSAVIIV